MVSGIFDRMLDREGGLFLKSIYEIEIPITCVRDTYSDTIKAPITDHDLRIIFTKSIYTCLLPVHFCLAKSFSIYGVA